MYVDSTRFPVNFRNAYYVCLVKYTTSSNEKNRSVPLNSTIRRAPSHFTAISGFLWTLDHASPPYYGLYGAHDDVYYPHCKRLSE